MNLIVLEYRLYVLMVLLIVEPLINIVFFLNINNFLQIYLLTVFNRFKYRTVNSNSFGVFLVDCSLTFSHCRVKQASRLLIIGKHLIKAD